MEMPLTLLILVLRILVSIVIVVEDGSDTVHVPGEQVSALVLVNYLF